MEIRNLKVVLKDLIVIYCLFGLFIFLTQKSMLYYPDNQDFESCEGFKDYQKINFQGTRFYYKENSSDNIIVYYHGNAGSACDRSYFKEFFEQPNFSVMFVEYAGYSNDQKTPSKDLILQDVRNVNDFIKEKSFKKVIIYGGSIGSGAASYHTSIGQVDSLIFVGSFSSLKDVAQSKFPIFPADVLFKENYDNLKWLKNYQGRIIILHGNKDKVIPHKFSQKLFEGIPTDKKEYVLIEGKGHNDIWNSSLFREKIVEFINSQNN